MKIVAKIGKAVAILTLGALSLASCVREEVTRPHKEGKGTTFYLHLPAPASVETRAANPVDENRISNLHILVFDSNDKLTEKIDVTATLAKASSDPEYQNDNVWSFTAVVESGYTLVALANAADKVPALSVGQTKTNIAKAVLYTKPAGDKWDVSASGTIPMWGELTGYDLATPTTCRFKMTRMLARIQLNAAYSDVTQVFKLDKVYFYNYNTKGYLMPDNTPASAPTTWGASSMGKNLNSYLDYSSALSSSLTGLEFPIYTFEAEAGNEFSLSQPALTKWVGNPCLVIGGRYDSDGDGNYDDEQITYYRIDFIKKAETDEQADQWLSLLRNHSYNVEVRSVDGPGYETARLAYESVPMNIDASTYFYNHTQTELTSVDGPYYLTVEKIKLEYYWWEQFTLDLEVKTNYSQGWEAEITNIGGHSNISFDGVFQYSADESRITLPITFSGSSNNISNSWQIVDGEPRLLSEIMIKAGRMSKKIQVSLKSIAPLFARSNVVYNENLDRVEFAGTSEDNARIPANVQGVFFKWGSVEALSPVEKDFKPGYGFTNSTTLFATGYISYSTWDKTKYLTSADHPDAFQSHARTDYDFGGYNRGLGYNITQHKGDICHYISVKGWVKGDWRTPTGEELYRLSQEINFVKDRGGIVGSITPVGSNSYGNYRHGYYTPDSGSWLGAGMKGLGTESITNPGKFVVYVPDGGCRNGTGQFTEVGSLGYLSSATTAAAGEYVYALQIDRYVSEVSPLYPAQYAAPVRCIRDYKTE